MHTLTADRPTAMVAAGRTACAVCGAPADQFRLYRHIDSTLSEIPDGLDRPRRVQARVERCGACGVYRTVHLSEAWTVRELYEHQSVCFEASASKLRLAGARSVSSSDELRLLSLPPPARLLDVGCGAGQFLLRAARAGYEVTGIEVDPRAIRFTREELGLEVRCATLEELPASETFDVISLLGVLEHLPQPVAALRAARCRLRPGGELLIGVPNVASLNRVLSRLSRHDWDMFLEPGHLYHFNLTTLSGVAGQAALRLRRWMTGTMTIRGKVPFLPRRWVGLERWVQRQAADRPVVRRLYEGGLRWLDRCRAGDMLFATFERSDDV